MNKIIKAHVIGCIGVHDSLQKVPPFKTLCNTFKTKLWVDGLVMELHTSHHLQLCHEHLHREHLRINKRTDVCERCYCETMQKEGRGEKKKKRRMKTERVAGFQRPPRRRSSHSG